jgi:hypothetical protein
VSANFEPPDLQHPEPFNALTEREQENFVMKLQLKNSLASKNDFVALALWRSLHANAFAADDLNKLHLQMQRVDLVGEPAWRLARMGDAGAAIGVAIRVGIKKRCAPQVVDLAMSAVLASAMKGDSAARHFLAHMLEKRGANSLADSWIAANRSAALNAPLARVKSAQRQQPSSFVESSRTHG